VITKDSKRAYCVSWTALGAVATLDLVNNKLLRYTPGFKFPHGICLSKDEKKVYIAAQTGNYISEIDSSFDVSTINEYALDGGLVNTATSLDPHDMALSPNGAQLIVTCQKTNEVIVFDLQTHQPVKRISTPVYPQEIIYSPRFSAFYVACSGDGTTTETGAVLKIDELGYASQNAKLGAQPHGLAVDEKTGILYLVSRNISSNGPLPHHTSQCAGRNGFVSLVDPVTLKLTGEKFEMSVDPYFIYVRP
jgi:WD40 repeat protein